VSGFNTIENAFDLVCSEYLDLFKTHYPVASGGGMNEANQTYYFCKSLSQVINDNLSAQEIKSAVSLETPYGKNMRMDGVVVSPSTKEVFLIQAKRLKNSQMDAVIDDVKKVYDSRSTLLNKIQKANDPTKYKVYLVILADMWLHKSNSKKQVNRLTIPLWWAGENSEEIKVNFSDNKFNLLPPERYFVNDVAQLFTWENKNQLIHRFFDYEGELPKKSVLNEYCLFCGSCEI
jgi:hypothetical protein